MLGRFSRLRIKSQKRKSFGFYGTEVVMGFNGRVSIKGKHIRMGKVREHIGPLIFQMVFKSGGIAQPNPI